MIWERRNWICYSQSFRRPRAKVKSAHETSDPSGRHLSLVSVAWSSHSLNTDRPTRVPTIGTLKFPNNSEKFPPVLAAMKTPFYTRNSEVCARVLVRVMMYCYSAKKRLFSFLSVLNGNHGWTENSLTALIVWLVFAADIKLPWLANSRLILVSCTRALFSLQKQSKKSCNKQLIYLERSVFTGKS